MSGTRRQNRQERHFLLAAIFLSFVATQCLAFAAPPLSVSKHTVTARKVDTNGSMPLPFVSLSTKRMGSTKRDESTSSFTCFQPHDAPYLAVITEPDACDTEERISETISAVATAVSTRKVALVSVRVVQPQSQQSESFHHPPHVFQDRIVKLTTQLMELSKQYDFKVVVTSDWVNEAIISNAHGIHVKERHQRHIPQIRQEFAPSSPLIGTSAHDVDSVLNATRTYQPDYFFVGTCYPTESHPEKKESQLEGPSLVGLVVQALTVECSIETRPAVLAIGGINPYNCVEPVARYGADGVATIRSILRAADASEAVNSVIRNMRGDNDL